MFASLGGDRVLLVERSPVGFEVCSASEMPELIDYLVCQTSKFACAPGRCVANGSPEHREAIERLYTKLGRMLADSERWARWFRVEPDTDGDG